MVSLFAAITLPRAVLADAVPSATTKCIPTTTTNLYTCLFTVTPGVPAPMNDGVTGFDVLHINEPSVPQTTYPWYLTSTPTVGLVLGCAEVPSPLTQSSPTSYHAKMGVSGCAGTTWSVQFIETIAVTAGGQICQSFFMLASVSAVTTCAMVPQAEPPSVTPFPNKGTFATVPNFSTSNLAMVVFGGGTIHELEVAALAAGGADVWVQDSTGAFQLLLADGPSFVKDAFAVKFPGGFATAVGVTLVRSALPPELGRPLCRVSECMLP